MLFYEPKENFRIIFTKDKENDFGKVIKELGYAKKDGSPYKYVNVQKGSFVKIDGAVETLQATKLTAKGKDTYIVNDSIEFKSGPRGASKFASVVNTFGNNFDLNIDNKNFKGKFTPSSDGSVKDGDGVVISLGSETGTDVSSPELTQFIYKMRQDNGNMLAPILRKYITALHFVGKNRKLITGYAHLPTYLQLIKSPFGDLAKSLRQNKGSSTGLVLGAGKNDFMAKVVVRGVKGRKILLELNSSAKLSKSEGSKETPNPYVVFSTKPIKFTSEETPKFAISMGRQTIFVTIFMFSGEKYLTDLQGGMNLLKMW